MAAIGSIRKHGVLLMVVIGFALVLFLLTGLFDNNTFVRIFYANQYTMGKVDGERVDDEYRVLYDQNTALLKVLWEKNTFTETENYQIHQITWSQLVDEIAVDKQLDKLGIIFNKEFTDNIIEEAKGSIYTQQPNPYINAYAQYLLNLGVGAENVQSILANIEEYRNVDWARDIYVSFKAIERRIIFETKINTYSAFSQGTIYYSDALARKIGSDNQAAMTSLVTVNPTSPAFNDLVVNVSEEEMKDWYKKNKERYALKEDTRDIDVAILPIVPTPEDKALIEENVRNKYESFVTVSSIDSFNMMEMYSPVDSTYHKMGDGIVVNSQGGYLSINMDALDSLLYKRPVGSVIEPYNYEDEMWFFGKTYGMAYRPDSIHVAYLLVDYRSSQNPNGTRSKKQARRESDSLKNILQSGSASIFGMMPQYAGGRQPEDTTMWYAENFAPRVLYNELVKSPNGSFYVDEIPSAFVIYQVLGRTNPVEKRQYALYSFEIKASENTVNNLRSSASQLAASSTSSDDFIDEANTRGIQIIRGPGTTSMMANIGQLTDCRPIVSWAFGEDVEPNSISDVFKLEDRMFAIASVKNTRSKGTPKFEEVKSTISEELTAMRKIESVENKLKEEVNAGTSMSEIARKYNTVFADSVRLTFIGETYQNRGVENGAIGKIFANPASSQPQVVSGKNMVYLVAVQNISDQAASANLQAEKNMLRNITIGRSRNEMLIIEGLKDNIDIWDNRARFYPN